GTLAFDVKSDLDDFRSVFIDTSLFGPSPVLGGARTGVIGTWETTDAGATSISTYASALSSATPGQNAGLYMSIATTSVPAGEIRGQLVGSATDSAEVVTGTAGADVLIGLGGADTIQGGAGDFVMYFVEQFAGGSHGVYVDLASGFAQDTFGNYDTLIGIQNVAGSYAERAPGLSDIIVGNASANVILADGGLDYVIAGAGNDTIDTGPGDFGTVGDIALGQAGNDFMSGEEGATFLYGGDGNDTLHGSDGDDWLFGGDFTGSVAGLDQMFGDAGNDVLAVGSAGGRANMSGGAGNDTIYGGSGTPADDTLAGGSGSDFMYGGSGGNDTFRFEQADILAGDFDQVLGFAAGDSLSFAPALSGSIYGLTTTINGVQGTYMGHANGWALWLPYTTWTAVQSQVSYV
ncbi:MAG: calcium-binding protein, partial [Hyphomicrobiaceae bacterium]